MPIPGFDAQERRTIEDCVRNLLQLQIDHETVRKGIMSAPATVKDEEYLGPIII